MTPATLALRSARECPSRSAQLADFVSQVVGDGANHYLYRLTDLYNAEGSCLLECLHINQGRIDDLYAQARDAGLDAVDVFVAT